MRTLDPHVYWTAAGFDPAHPEHERHFVRTQTFAAQEEALMAVLERLEFRSVLEVGCGWGRITKIVRKRWPAIPYTAIDISPERLASASRKAPDVEFVESSIADYRPGRQWDLVLAVETLMHVPPDEIAAAVDRLHRLARRHIVSLDWTADLGSKPIAAHNWRHDYAELYGSVLVRTEPVGLQSIHVVGRQ
jgi:trans-aconitate methyltransferase